MTFDISKYAQQIAQSAQARMHRENLSEGVHVIRLESIDGFASQKDGNEYIVIEGVVIESTTMTKDTPIKHFYQLTGCPVWKKDGNLKALKAFVCAVLPPSYSNQIDASVVINACSGGSNSALVPYMVRARVTSKTSKNDKAFLETSWQHYSNQNFGDDGSASNIDPSMPF